MIFVDELRQYPFSMINPLARKHGRMWCHLTADSEEELHAFALRLGLKRSWAQRSKGGVPHYDLTPGKRNQALKAGAIFQPGKLRIKRRKEAES